MAKQSKNKSKQVSQHVYRGCRDAIQPNTPSAGPLSSGTNVVITTANTPVNLAGVLNPIGLTTTALSSGAYTMPSDRNLQGPPLRGLCIKAQGFQYYRVTRAKLVMVGSIGTNLVGQITMAGYGDPADVRNITYSPFSSGPNTRTFDLSTLSGKEISVPIPVDSTWKRVTAVLSAPGNNYPFNASDATTLAIYNTVSNVSFGAWTILANCNTALTLGSLYIDYDVEFKNPIDYAVNL